MGDGKLVDILHRDGFMCPLAGHLMGVTAETLVEKYDISREEQDEYAVECQNKAVAAMKEGLFKEEILPIEIPVGKGKTEIFDTEETPHLKNWEIAKDYLHIIHLETASHVQSDATL